MTFDICKMLKMQIVFSQIGKFFNSSPIITTQNLEKGVAEFYNFDLISIYPFQIVVI